MPLPKKKFRDLYDTHVQGVRNLLFHKCGSNDLDDLTQMTFLKVWKNYEKFRGDSQVKTWIYRSAWNTAFDHLRKKQVAGTQVELPDLVSKDTMKLKAEVKDLLNKLSSDSRDLCHLYYFESFTVEEIAKVMEVPTGTVKSRLHKLREELRGFF